MLSTDQMRAVVYLKTQKCCGTAETLIVHHPPELAGKYCKDCVEELARMLGDAHYGGRMHERNEAPRCACQA